MFRNFVLIFSSLVVCIPALSFAEAYDEAEVIAITPLTKMVRTGYDRVCPEVVQESTEDVKTSTSDKNESWMPIIIGAGLGAAVGNRMSDGNKGRDALGGLIVGGVLGNEARKAGNRTEEKQVTRQPTQRCEMVPKEEARVYAYDIKIRYRNGSEDSIRTTRDPGNIQTIRVRMVPSL